MLGLLRQWWKARPSRYDAGIPLQERWLFPSRKSTGRKNLPPFSSLCVRMKRSAHTAAAVAGEGARRLQKQLSARQERIGAARLLEAAGSCERRRCKAGCGGEARGKLPVGSVLPPVASTNSALFSAPSRSSSRSSFAKENDARLTHHSFTQPGAVNT
jgi:hypothetical protein